MCYDIARKCKNTDFIIRYSEYDIDGYELFRWFTGTIRDFDKLGLDNETIKTSRFYNIREDGK